MRKEGFVSVQSLLSIFAMSTRAGSNRSMVMKEYRFTLILLFPLLFSCHHAAKTRFEKISSGHSGISFQNDIVETDSINPINVVNIYNGGGVGIGDFNNDGLPDIYFGGNMVSSRLYLNKGHFEFEDITEKAGVEGMGRWARGISVVDVNNDGLADIYICNTIHRDPSRRRNILYINQGLDKDGIPHFKDMATAYGLDANGQSTMASFFDYDNDGDLDMYLTVNEASNGDAPSTFLTRNTRNLAPSLGRLYRNDWDSSLGHPVFHDVSAEAGIKYEGYGHAASICDINQDGWKDIYVSDDFLSSNILYINNHDGTFTNQVKDYFKHTSYNSMGQDVVDINNDGLADVIELDMNPEDNYRKKMMLASDSYLTYQNFDSYGYEYQFVRNTLQLNQGPRVGHKDSIGIPAFSEIGFLAGISQTDWSWTPLVADLDNDGYRDLMVTNGFPRDVSDHDFMAYREENKGFTNTASLLEQIPKVKLHNYAFKNSGNLSFTDQTTAWGFDQPTFSTAAAYADFDGDGAIDVVINNTNEAPLLYRNTSRDVDSASTHFLEVKFKGSGKNTQGIGAHVAIYYDHGKQQVYDNNPYRGYLSSMQALAHFGLGKNTRIDSLVVVWGSGKQQTMMDMAGDRSIVLDIANAKEMHPVSMPSLATNALFTEDARGHGINYRHHDYDYNDFDIQHMLPHKLSEYAPALASADLDGNGYDDIVIGGNAVYPTHVLFQQPDGQFIQKDSLPGNYQRSKFSKDEGILLFDANGDGKPDVYIASGGYELTPGHVGYQDRLYINDGKGQFTLDSAALPINHTSKSCVRAIDYDNDGRMDLFVSGRVDPWNYPRPVSSFIFHNESVNGHVKFVDVTADICPALKDIGMVCDALFTDFNGDGQPDMIVAGEWMPIEFFQNVQGKFKQVTNTTGVGNQRGWWNSIVGGDFRHTGRTDYIVGNVGLNTLYQASDKWPVYITAKDFDSNGKYVGIPSLYLPGKDGVKREYPMPGRDDITRQLSSMKKKFSNYKTYANASMDEVLSPAQRQGALRLEVNNLQSCFIQNNGNGKFTMIPLPMPAQFSAINGMVVDDFDGDGNLDVLINGNDYGTSIGIGRYDAFNGLLLKGDGNGGFRALSMLESGVCISGNGKALVKLRSANGGVLVAASQNRGDLLLFEKRKPSRDLTVLPDDQVALIQYTNGKTENRELNQGSSFLSQSANFIMIDDIVSKVTVRNRKGVERIIYPDQGTGKKGTR